MDVNGADRSKQLVVVARDEISLYQTLREAFTELPGVEVIRDRRVSPPRSPVLERRRSTRVEAEMLRAGYAVVQVKDRPAPRSRPTAAGH